MQRLFSWTGMLATGALLVGGSTRVEAQVPTPAPIQAHAPKMVTKVFQVAELVCLPPNYELTDTKPRLSHAPTIELSADRLMTQITAMIAPGTWDSDGGSGRIEFFERSLALVVCHTPETCNQIGAALEKLKKRQETTVAFQFQIVRVPAGTESLPNATGKSIGSLNQDEVQTLLGSLAGNRSANVVSLPKMMVFHGQNTTMAVGEEKPVVINRTYTHSDGSGYSIPETTTTRWTGFKVGVCPMVATDRKSMRVRLGWETSTEQPDRITLNSGTKTTLASFKDGKPAGPAEVELTETCPAFNLKSCQCTIDFRDGKTHLVDMGIRKVGDTREQSYLLISATLLPYEAEEKVAVTQPVGRPTPPLPPPAPPMAYAPPPMLAHAEFAGPVVHTQAYFVKMSPEEAKKQGLTKPVTFLDEKQTFHFQFEGKPDLLQVLCCPQLMLRNKQVGYFECGVPQIVEGGKIVVSPPSTSGSQVLRVTPTVSADSRFIRLEVQANCTDEGTKKVIVSTTTNPLQLHNVQVKEVRACDVQTTVPDGGTVCMAVEPKLESKANGEKTFLFLTSRLLHEPPASAQPPMTVPPAAHWMPTGPQPMLPSTPPTPFEGPQVYAQMLMVKLTPEIAKKHGLTKAMAMDEKQVAALQSDLQKKNSGCEVISAPQLVLMDKQVGYFQDGCSDGSQGVKMRMTPTFSTDRRYVRMKMEVECAGTDKRCCDVETTVADGGTACLVLDPKPGDKPSDANTFLLVTSHVLRTTQDKDRVGTEMTKGMQVASAPPTAVHPYPVPVMIPTPGLTLNQVRFRVPLGVPADRKAKAAEWVTAYEKACAGAAGPSPAECAMRALAEDPLCFAKPASK